MRCAQLNLISLPQSKKFLFREYCMQAKQVLDVAETNGQLAEAQQNIQARLTELFLLR